MLKRLMLMCAQTVVVVAVCAVLVAYFRWGGLSFRYVFTANFGVGGVIILAGLVVTYMPVIFPRGDKLLDHTTYTERMLKAREEKRRRGFELLYIGMGVIIVAALVQLALSYII